MDRPIKYISPDCGEKTLDVKFDKDIKRENVPVSQSLQIYTLDPYESADMSSGMPKYIATSPGKINAKVIFHYTVDNVPNQYTESLSFDILPKSIHGTNGDDTIVGALNDDEILGFGGNDILNGGDGDNDIIEGDTGNDRLFGEVDVTEDQAGKDTLFGGPGNDSLHGGPKADLFNCGLGIDSIDDFNPQEGDQKRNDCENF